MRVTARIVMQVHAARRDVAYTKRKLLQKLLLKVLSYEIMSCMWLQTDFCVRAPSLVTLEMDGLRKDVAYAQASNLDGFKSALLLDAMETG